jgi:signal transduction histidine kinase
MTVTTPPRAQIGVPHRPLRRGVDNALVGGVCGGVAIRLGVRERTVRVLACLATLVWGVGLLVYLALWLTVPRAGEERSIASRLLGGRNRLLRVAVAVAVVVVVLLVLHPFSQLLLGPLSWAFLVSVLGLIVVWRGATSDERQHLEDLGRNVPLVRAHDGWGKTSALVRTILGLVLVFLGVRLLAVVGRRVDGGAPAAIFGAAIVVAGVVVVFAPWWLSLAHDLSTERRSRVRVEERAKLATHLHDSVLQTLTLIERSAGDRAQVTRLARNQERELRQWLFGPETSNHGSTLSGALNDVVAEIENDYGVRVELVVVGDAPLDPALADLVAAGREGAINAARWSGVDRVSIYAEVESDKVTLFVRDLGHGFDPDAVPDDRHGLAVSIRQRLAARAGSATVRSTIGEGTEVALEVPHP